MNNYANILEELKQDIKDSILTKASVIQVDFYSTPCKWYYSDATMQRDFLSAKKDFDEGDLDFPMFEKIENIYNTYQDNRNSLTQMTVEDAMNFLEEKIAGKK